MLIYLTLVTFSLMTKRTWVESRFDSPFGFNRRCPSQQTYSTRPFQPSLQYSSKQYSSKVISTTPNAMHKIIWSFSCCAVLMNGHQAAAVAFFFRLANFFDSTHGLISRQSSHTLEQEPTFHTPLLLRRPLSSLFLSVCPSILYHIYHYIFN